MKERVRIDSSILSFIIILTGLLYQFPQLYTHGLLADDIFDFFGMIIVLFGAFLRMVARGYKKAHSGKGHDLVKTGPYGLVRNPMYLGSFLMGSGFILIVWPWWSLPMFAILFYIRFNKQMIEEEAHLTKLFGEPYVGYARETPRIFPSINSLKRTKFRKVFPFENSWRTKEKWGLLGWPVLAVTLEVLQEKIIYGIVDAGNAIHIFLLSIIAFAFVVLALYRNA